MKANWEYKKLGDVCVSELGKTLNQSKDIGTHRPYLCAINIQWDSLNLSNLKQARFEDDELERYSVQKGDLLVCEGGDVGRAAIWDNSEPMLYQNALHRLRFSKGFYPRFYLFCLRSLKNKGVLDNRYAKGVTIKHLVKSSLMSIPVPVPPLSEQKRIVAELDLLTEVIDKQKTQLKELDTLAQSIFYDMFGDPIENPKGWDVKKWGELFHTILGKMLDAKKQNPNDEIRPYLGNTNVQWFSFDLSALKTMSFSSKELEKFALKKGDILLCEGGESGRCAVWEDENASVLFQKAIHRARIKDYSLVEPHFIPFLIKSMKEKGGLKNFVSKATIEHLTGEKLAVVPLILPPLALQQSFADKIQSIENQKAKINQSIADTQKLLDYTMDKYFG